MRKVESPLSLITGSSISLQKENNKHLIFEKINNNFYFDQ